MCSHWAHGGEGAKALAEAVVEACKEKNTFNYLYPLDLSIKEKIESIAKNVSFLFYYVSFFGYPKIS